MAVFNNILAGASGATGAAGFQIDRSLRFNDGDSPSLSRNFSSAGNRKKWTWSGWFKVASTSQPGRLFSAGADATNRTNIFYYPRSNNLGIGFYSYVGGALVGQAGTTAVLADHSAWYHLVFAFDAANSTTADRLKIYINGVEQAISYTVNVSDIDHLVSNNIAHYVGRGADGYSFDGYLAEVHFIDGQALAQTDFGEYDDNNVWQPKEYSGTYGTNGFHLDFADNSSNAALGTDSSGNNNDWTVNNLSVASGAGNDSLIDTPTNYEAASGNNGGNYATLNPLLKPSGATLSDGNLEFTSSSNYQTGLSTIGMSSGKWYFEASISVFGTDAIIGIVSDLHFGPDYFPGSSSSPNSYGYEAAVPYLYPTNTSGYSTYTTGDIIGVAYDADNGKIYFAKNGVWGNSSDPVNGTNPGFTGITGGPHFFAVSAGTNGKWVTNFGQRPFAYTPPTGYVSLCTQNLDATIADGSTAMDIVLYDGNNSTNAITGLGFSPDALWLKSKTSGAFPAIANTVVGPNYFLRTNDTVAESGPGFNNDIVSFDDYGFTLGADTYYAFCNRSPNTYVAWTWDGGTVANPVGDTWQGTATKYIGIKFASASGGTVSFGQTTGTDTVEVWTSSDNSNWTQNGGTLTLSSGHTVTTSDQYVYIRNTSDATFTNWYAAATNGADGHYSSVTYPSGASWTGPAYTDYDWRDDGGVINTNGSILSIVRANPSAGFSIAAFSKSSGTSTTNTVGHSLGAEPHFIITKQRDGTEPWYCYHKALGASARIQLNEPSAQTTGSTVWGSTAPTSSVFSIRNVLNGDYLALLFAPVEGYSAFGSYEGNGSTDGTFVYTGFRPAFLLIKRTDASSSWYIFDSTRSTFNVVDDRLQAHSGNAENTNSAWNNDFLSNGFKLRTAEIELNNNGSSYIYAAFAEHPFKTSRAR